MAKCKHENADHLMPGDSTEPGYRLHVQNNLVECLRCLDCGHWLPLGPAAAETPEVAVEKRAAEIAAQWAPLDKSNYGERDGWAWHKDGHLPLMMMDPYNAGRLAGYLARVIATHDEKEQT